MNSRFKTKLKEGDIVIITKSDINWTSSMNEFEGVVCKIISIKDELLYEQAILSVIKDPKLRNIMHLNREMRMWDWVEEHKHFRHIDDVKVKKIKFPTILEVK